MYKSKGLYITTTTTNNMRNVKCTKCGYEWETRSDKKWITCTNCQKKFEIKDIKPGVALDETSSS